MSDHILDLQTVELRRPAWRDDQKRLRALQAEATLRWMQSNDFESSQKWYNAAQHYDRLSRSAALDSALTRKR